MSTQVGQWRVSSADGAFETDLETLKEWIVAGRVLPTDKVSKGSLSPIEARRVPALRSVFDGEADSAPSTVTADKTAQMHDSSSAITEPFPDSSKFDHVSSSPGHVGATTELPSACQGHSDLAPRHICLACNAAFCDQCPRWVTGTPLCPLCGDFCKPFEEERAKAELRQFQSSAFGLPDFVRALRYPLQHKVTLFAGAILYGLLLLAGFWGRLAAYAIMFGCISHVISQLAWGRVKESFMPDFSEFSMWDDLGVPIGLGLGITIVTWGPMIVLVLALFFGITGSAGRLSLVESPSKSDPRSAAMTREDLSTLADPNADGKKLEEANKKLDQLRPGHQISQEAEKSKQAQNDPMADWRFTMALLGASALLLILGLLSLAWGIFYYPMALAVAGYTQRFAAVVNPVIGIDTIRRMGANYFKAFGMVLGLQAVGLIVGVVVATITSPFVLPFVGNLPARFIDGSITFYVNLVIACVLGLSLFKCGERLGIYVD